MIRPSRSTWAALRVAATAAVGVVAGHVVGYRLVFPGVPQRHGVLVETGHGYLPLGLRLAVMLTVVVAAAAVTGGYRRARARRGVKPRFAGTAWRLAVLQVAGFVSLELLERLASGVPLHHFLLPVVAIGIAAQIAVAALGAALLVALDRAGHAAGARRTGPALGRTSVPSAAAYQSITVRRPDPPRSIRGPPVIASQGA